MADFMSRADLDFLLYDWLDVSELTARPRFADHTRETFDAVLDLSHDMAAKLFAPHNKKSDQNEPQIGADGKVVLLDEVVTAVRTFGEAGLNAGSFDAELGGMQLPHTLSRASMVNFQAANAATSSYGFLTVGNANLLAKYGSPGGRSSPGTTAGPESTSPARPSGWSSAYESAIAPPMLWPITYSGSPARSTESITRFTSATKSPNSRTSAGVPSDRPCPA